MADIQAAVKQQDGVRLSAAAHSLKGMSVVFDMHQVYAHAKSLEIMGEDGDFSGAEAVAEELVAELGAVKGRLHAFIARQEQSNRQR